MALPLARHKTDHGDMGKVYFPNHKHVKETNTMFRTIFIKLRNAGAVTADTRFWEVNKGKKLLLFRQSFNLFPVGGICQEVWQTDSLVLFQVLAHQRTF